MLVCKLYKLGRFEGNRFDKDHKKGKLLRKKALITEEYFNHNNDNWQDTGKLYVVNQKATDDWKKENQEWQEKRNEEKQKAKNLQNVGQLAEALQNISSSSGNNKAGGAEGGQNVK